MKSILTESAIRGKMCAKYADIPMTIYPIIGSTNVEAIEYARSLKSTPDTPLIFLANEQTAGRGRLGRTFISPRGQGIYLSILIPLSLLANNANGAPSPVAITTYAATIMVKAISALTPLAPKIKWVNDIYVGGKKIAGILTQGVMTDSGKIDYAVMGVGINVYGTELPEEIEAIATTIERELASRDKASEPVPPPREALIAKIIELFLDNLPNVGTRETADEYRAHSYLIGKDINVIRVDRTYPARVVGINDECELILRLADGTEETLATGEVSVREVK